MGRLFWIATAILGGGLILLVINDSSGQVLGMGTGQFGSLIYLGALGALVASGIVASSQRFGDTARMLAIWLLVILALMAGFQYRYELQDVANRVSGGLVPGSPLTAFDDEGRAVVTLQKRMDGHFEASLAVDGTPVSTIVDTGATSTVLTAADAARAGFDTAALNFTIPVSTANGTARAARVVAATASVGAIERRNLPILVAEPGQLDQSLLGMNFIGTLAGFDVRGDRLILRD
ncbi:MAG: TIGR02281 family clan AA aspartic protease [Alphaproteobacteria bacterium]|nr:TIGR02281 family clan AA aspartic protease [Alphaproteobacteria bacterium]MBU0802398.1 TIGR02281 family clan AA aspartic protease [Alphaproteobacteria bacterium]MBU0870160.1 TIGR02281 family clan AA aspartic protease [Alphaproteobacteria bacterium]MBU1399897.1 TIGR02281 family clan AA aspartic protease [Alphaproteobacteria bacterium]MBU1590283.1 TIGR02281 family clan AA aspartic protease [Alphaproteobacteria bacterium]